MFKKFATFMALALVLAPVSNVLAVMRTWDGGSVVDDDWGTKENWSLDTEPTYADDVKLQGQAGIDVTNVTQAGEVCNLLRAVNGISGTHTLNIKNGGWLDADAGMQFVDGGFDNMFATINIETGGKLSSSVLGCMLVWPTGTAGVALDEVCTVNMQGGTFDIKAGLTLSRVGYNNPAYHGEVHLYSGTIYSASFVMTNRAATQQDDVMTVGAGVLYVKGDVQSTFTNIGGTGYIDVGLITPQAGYGSVQVTTETLSSPLAGSGLYTKVYATPIPEPGTMLLAGFGVLLLLVTRRKR